MRSINMNIARTRNTGFPVYPARPARPRIHRTITAAGGSMMTVLEDTVADVQMHLTRFARERRLQTVPSIPPSEKKKLIVLGSGWGAHSLIKIINTDKFDVTVISPRNFYVFTPMLPSCAVGTVEFRSLVDPIRVANPFVTYIEAKATDVDPQRKTLSCVCTAGGGVESTSPREFEMAYDYLFVSIGEVPATFGVPGVAEHCYFMKETDDAIKIRRRIGECFELAASPTTTREEKKALLSFVVVGGGPTGVEFAGSLSDYINRDLRPRYAAIEDLITVQLLQSGQSILTVFQANLQKRALDNMTKSGIEVRTGVRVVAVESRSLTLESGEVVPFGLCLWSAGNSANPFTARIQERIPEQRAAALGDGQRRGVPKLIVDAYQRVVGAPGMLAVGDCCTVEEGERLPATAQVASQQAAYVTRLLNRGFDLKKGGEAAPEREGGQTADPFQFLSLGLMAYIGNDRALIQTEVSDIQYGLSGRVALLLWSSTYLVKQVSTRNRVLILFDWIKTRVFGRDLSLL